MKREERRQAIMDLLIAARAVDLDDLAGRFAVSKMTIHRDLDDLEQTGLLRKVRGGATVEAGIASFMLEDEVVRCFRCLHVVLDE